MKTFFLFFFLALLPSVSAFDCSRTIDADTCDEILNLRLPADQEEYLLGSVVYPFDEPNYTYVASYNRAIAVTTPPDNTTLVSSTYIKNAWVSLLTLFPSVHEEDILYVPTQTTILSAYGYQIEIPKKIASGDCDTKYALSKNSSAVNILSNGNKVGEGKDVLVSVSTSGQITSQLQVNTEISVQHYKEKKYCCSYKKGKCKAWCTKCEYDNTETKKDSLTTSESRDIVLYSEHPSASLVVTNQYGSTTKGNFSASNYTFFAVTFDNAYYKEYDKVYTIVFDKIPYYFITLQALNQTRTEQFNVNVNNKTFFVHSPANCTLFASNYFYNYSSVCDVTLQQEAVSPFNIVKRDGDFSLLIQIIIFAIISYFILKEIKKRLFIIFSLIILCIPFVHAEECGVTNLASCLPEYLYNYFLEIINAPLQPLLTLIKDLLTADVSIDIFYPVWQAVCYGLSFFYLILFVYAGFLFLTAGGNPIKRSKAKEALQNYVLMIILIAASYYLYDLILSLCSTLSTALLGIIDENFFLLTFDNFVNIALEGVFVTLYLLALLIALLLLVIRYIVVSFGVILFPIGIFCYFIPPLRGYGRFILNLLAIFIFIVIIDLLIILVCSKIVESSVFENFTILVMIASFFLINCSLIWAVKFAITKSSVDSIKDDVEQAVKYISMVV